MRLDPGPDRLQLADPTGPDGADAAPTAESGAAPASDPCICGDPDKDHWLKVPLERRRVESSAPTSSSPEVLQRFVGGQLELHSGRGALLGGKTHRGDIAAIDIEGTDAVIRLAWLATMENPVEGWFVDSRSQATFPLALFPSPDQWGRLVFDAGDGEVVVLFPPGYTGPTGAARRLEPSQVKGLGASGPARGGL